jgi:hypothetical protein
VAGSSYMVNGLVEVCLWCGSERRGAKEEVLVLYLLRHTNEAFRASVA